MKSKTVSILKAFGIFLLILGHSLDETSFLRHVLYGFHVPLFLILSGLVYKKSNLSLIDYVKYKFKKIMVPYYLFGIISIIIYLIVAKYIGETNPVSLSNCIFGLIWSNGENGFMRWNLPLWFLPMFFVIQLFAFYFKKTNLSNKKLSIILVLNIIISIILYDIVKITNLPLCIETAVYLFPFYIIGIMINQNLDFSKKIIVNKKVLSFLIMSIILVISIVLIYLNGIIDYVSDQYRIYIIFMLLANLTCIPIIFLSYIINVDSNKLVFIGNNTLYILCIHKFPIMFFKKVCPIIKNYSSFDSIGIMISIFTLILCSIFIYLFKKILCYRKW